MTAYQPLLALQVEHAFYADGLCRALSLTPTPATLRRLQRAGCLLKALDGGMLVLADAGRIGAFVADASEPFALDLLGRSHDAAFATATQGSPAGRESAFLFTRTVAEGADGDCRLHEAALAGAADVEPLDSPRWAGLLSARDALLPPAFGVRLVLDSAAPLRCRLRFGARALPWKYCLVGPWERDGLYVADVDEAVRFTDFMPGRLPDGREVLWAQSVQPLALGERAAQRFQLRRRAAGSDRLVVKRLPVASARHWGAQGVDGQNSLVSEIYVNR